MKFINVIQLISICFEARRVALEDGIVMPKHVGVN